MLSLFFLIDRLFQIASALILIRVLVSWVPALGLHHPAIRSLDRIVTQVTGPIIDPIRRVMPPVGGMDLSPIIALMLLQLANQLFRSVLLTLL